MYVASEDDLLRYVIEQSRSEERNEAFDIFSGEEAVKWMNMYGLSADFVEACAVSYPMINVSAYTAAILKPTSNGEDPALEMLNTYKESRMLSFEHYLEEQYDCRRSHFYRGPIHLSCHGRRCGGGGAVHSQFVVASRYPHRY